MEKKIIIAFGCGLGNQMFQYVFYNNMKEKFPEYTIYKENNVVLRQQHNGYELDKVFGIDIPSCDKGDLSEYWKHLYDYGTFALPVNAIKYVVRRLNPNPSFFGQKNYTEYYPEVYAPKTYSKYLFKGIWANEKYFIKESKDIRPLFKFAHTQDVDADTLSRIINANDSVSIHFRRGDYVGTKSILLGAEYYKRAVTIINNKLENPQYWVFSDDVTEARRVFDDILPGGAVNYVTGNTGLDSWKDMFLMSKCKYNIIANSSFSFWGAYLNENNEKIVICPQEGMNKGLNPFACEGWLSI